MDRGRQSVEDKTTIQGYLDEGVEISRETPDKVRVLLDILQRIVDNGARVRSGPTKAMLIQLQGLIPIDFEVAGTSSKGDIVAEMLEKLRQNATEEADNDSDVAPEDIPEGWGDMDDANEVFGPTPLLRFRRREYSGLPKEEILWTNKRWSVAKSGTGTFLR